MKDFIKRLNENFDKKRSYLEESISLKSECIKTSEKPFSICDGVMYDEDEANIDRLFHDADQDELTKMGAFDNLNLEEAVKDIDINYMTISDLLSNMHENVPEDFLDNEIKFFKKLAKVFNTKIYDEIIVAVDDGDYDPKYVFSDGLEMPELGENVTYYPDERMIAENKYGNLYLYFVTEDDCKKYFAMAKKFLTDFDLDSDANIQEKMDKENLTYENLSEAIDVIDEFAPYSIIAHEINLSTNRYNKRKVAKRDTLESAEELAKIVAERISDVQGRNYVSIVDNDGEEVDIISGPYNSDINPNIDDLIETLNEEVVIKPTDNSYHDVWYLDDRYAVHNDGGRFHVIDRANGNNYLLNSDSIDEVNDYIRNTLNLDMSIEPSNRQFKKKAKIDTNKDEYLRAAAKMDWESGHPYDPDDFSYFKRVCREDGYNVTEDDFNKYFEYFDEIRSCYFDDDCDWFEDEE